MSTLATTAPGTTVDLGSVNPGVTRLRGGCLTIAAAAGAYECGDLRLAYALPGVRTLNRARAPVLLYSSAQAHPWVVVAANASISAGSAAPDSLSATLWVGDYRVAHGAWSGMGWAGATRRIALDLDAWQYPSGSYSYTLEVSTWYGSTQVITNAFGSFAVVNRRDSPLGAGWWVAGVEQLKLGGHILWIGGDGSTRFYLQDATNQWVSSGYDRPDTLRWDPTLNNYVRRLASGGRVYFDTQGRHVYTAPRVGRGTRFYYLDATSPVLTAIGVPTPTGELLYQLGYTGGLLSAVVAPSGGGAARMVGFSRTGVNLTITGVDGAARTYTSETGTAERIIGVRDERNAVSEYAYGPAGRLTGALRWGLGNSRDAARDVVQRFAPVEALGLPATGAVDPALAYTFYDGPRPDADAQDYLWVWTDPFGAPSQVKDAQGNVTRLTRGDSRFAALVTQVDAPGGGAAAGSMPGSGPRQVVSAVYDTRGNLQTSTTVNPLGNGQNAVTTYTYGNSQWPDFLTRVTSPTGIVRATGYDVVGNLTWQQVGSELPTVDFTTGTVTSGDTTRRVHFHYNSLGLVDSSWTTQAASMSPRPPAMRVTYDTLKGNLASVTTPLGFRTSYYADAIGRDTLVVPPLGAVTRTFYDLADHDTLTSTVGDATEGTLFVRTRYNHDLVLSVTRWSTPDPAGIGLVVTSWEYDPLGQPIRAFAEDSAVTTTHFDAAGNADTVTTRRGYRIATTYDPLNRPVRRVVPQAVAYSVASDTIKDSYSNQVLKILTFPNPAFANGAGGTFVPAADTAVFAYDGAGNLVQADNHDARISRTYYPNSLLRADTLRTRTWAELSAGGSFATHVYGLQYAYDIEGRRTSLRLPDGIAPRNSGTGQVYDQQTYGYDATTGALAWTQDALGNLFGFHYDKEGAPYSLSYPGGRWQRLYYDADGRVTQRRDIAPNWTAAVDPQKAIHDYTFQYDARNKLKSATDAATVYSPYNTSYDYTLLGALSKVQSSGGHNPLAEVYQFDALGNRISVRNNASANEPSISHFQARTSRLWWSGPDGTEAFYNAADIPTIDAARYDAAGNQDRYYVEDYGAATNRVTHSYFSADDRLVATDNQACKAQDTGSTSWWENMSCLGPAQLNNATAGSFEWYRYDALGRRVLVRTRRDVACNGNTTCGSTATRMVWDGDQVLMELRADGSGTGDPENDNLTGQAYYGKVAYTHAGGIDAPLDIIRMGYTPTNQASDTVDYHWGAWGGPYAIVPHANARGALDGGTTAFGHVLPCSLPSSTCTVVAWPGANYRAFYTTSSPVSQQTWNGSLIDKMTDASGLMYMRNRYYNPQTGSFTQRDPIGIAGGLNVYGFTAGDPVNYSDPYGLSRCSDLRKSIRRTVDVMQRRVSDYLEARGRGEADLDHLRQLDGWRNRYGSQMEQYKEEECYDDKDDDDDDFQPTIRRGNALQSLRMPYPQLKRNPRKHPPEPVVSGTPMPPRTAPERTPEQQKTQQQMTFLGMVTLAALALWGALEGQLGQ